MTFTRFVGGGFEVCPVCVVKNLHRHLIDEHRRVEGRIEVWEPREVSIAEFLEETPQKEGEK